jgi:hypothetical protein
MWHVWGTGELHAEFWWGRPVGKGTLGKFRPRWEDNIKTDLQEVVCGSMDWIVLAQDRDR